MITVTGPTIWYAGSWTGTGTTIFNSTVTILDNADSSNDPEFSRTLINNVQTIWTGGRVAATDNALFINSPDATFTINQSVGFDMYLLGTMNGTIHNYGTIINTGTASTIASSPNVWAYLINDNEVYSVKGRLFLAGGSYSSNGTYYALNGGSLAFGNAKMENGVNLTADSVSTIEWAYGNNYPYCTYNVTGQTWVTGGYTLFPKTAKLPVGDHYEYVQGITLVAGLGNKFHLGGGTFDLSTWNLTLPDTLLDYPGGILTGTGQLKITNATWQAGTMAGTGQTVVIGQMVLNGYPYSSTSTVKRVLSRLLRNEGSLYWQSGHFFIADASVLENAQNGTFVVAPDAAWNVQPAGTGMGSIVNYGLITRTALTTYINTFG